MGTDIEGLIEVRGRDGRWTARDWLPDCALVRDRYARECLFGYGGGLGVDIGRALFDQRGKPDDVSDDVPDDEINHSHSYATWAEVATVDWDAPLTDGASWTHIGTWLPGPRGELELDDVYGTPAEVLDAAEELFGEDLMPPEWPEGGEVHLNGAVYRPVDVTPRIFAPPDGDRWGPVWTTMRELAAEHGDENVRLVVWFG
ncbi:hypothetical protein [Streptomyces roseicoloratus]|uniref:hypothetical protein n=1 Tax=Streptomyces roseicoloratus TaxID=2508722 RepID=UPI0010099E14|nr:hypothetical protein [Streptomyces roseicoloratus]